MYPEHGDNLGGHLEVGVETKFDADSRGYIDLEGSKAFKMVIQASNFVKFS